MARPLPYNAKTLPFDRPGAGAFNYGVNDQNVARKLEKIWLDRATVDGGSKAIFNKISNWASPEQVTRRGGNPNDTQWKLWQNYIRTGKVDPNLRTDLAVRGLDLGLRETARAQQHKTTFWDSAFGKILKIGAPIAAGAFLPGLIPGLSAGWAGAGTGALVGGLDDGWQGALLGGTGGYFSGQAGGFLGNEFSAAGGFSELMNNPGYFARTFGHNVGGSIFNNAASRLPFSGVERGASTLANGMPNIPAFGGTSLVGSAVGTPMNPATGTAGAAVGGSGGGSMGALSDLWGGVRGVLSAGDYGGGNIFGDLVRGGLSYFGQQNAANNLNDAAQRAFENSRFIPYNVNTPGGSATFDGNNINTQLSPQAQAIANQYRALTAQNQKAYNAYNPIKYANTMYRTLSNLRAPAQTAENNNLLSNTYNLGRWGSTVGAQDIYSASMAQNLQDQALRLQSQQAGAAESDRLFTNYMRSAAAYDSMLRSPNDLARLGLAAGGAQSGANANAMQYPWLAAGADYGSSNAFWSTLANSAGNMITNAGNSINNGYNFRSNYQSQYNPDTGYFVDFPRFNYGK